jgi:hypothetical protein
MKHLIEVTPQGEFVIAPQVFAIKEFKDLWVKKKPEDSFLNMSIVYYYADIRSPYKGDWDSIGNNIMYNIPDWKPSQQMIDAAVKYEQLNRPPSADSLEAAEAAQKKLDIYLRDADPSADDSGKLATIIMNMINNMPKTVKSIQELRKAVEAELMEDTMLRAGREKGAFEDDSMNPD